jgi:hypothetical protein
MTGGMSMGVWYFGTAAGGSVPPGIAALMRNTLLRIASTETKKVPLILKKPRLDNIFSSSKKWNSDSINWIAKKFY